MIESSETKLFSQAFQRSDLLRTALLASSRSKEDAGNREKVYQKVFSNFEELKEISKMFSGYTEIPLLSNQYFNATVASYVTSWSGLISIERAMDQPIALLWFLDLIGATDNRVVLPNLGAENLNNISAQLNWSTVLTVGTPTYSVILGKKIIPGSIKLSLIHAAGGQPVVITDDGLGNFLAAPGILAGQSINYATGSISFTIGTGWTIALNDSASLICYEDSPGTPDVSAGGTGIPQNRFKTDWTNIQVDTYPELLIGESNIVALAAMQKATGTNAQDVLSSKLTELYTKIINKRLVASIVNNYQGTNPVIDISVATTSFTDFRSKLDALSAGLTDIDGDLAANSIKGVRATSYIVGPKLADWFGKMAAIGLFRENVDSTYINDLYGYYKNIPVLRHTDLADYEGYAIHKTVDGQMAPSIRGIFLPLTNSPSIGNYQNPTQVSQGVFYQEGIKSIASELSQHFTLNI